jgi:hypothetical protein
MNPVKGSRPWRPSTSKAGERWEMPNQRDSLDGLSEDPNCELAKRFYLEAWADSHGLVADGLAGRISFPELIESCVNTFAQGATVHVNFNDSSSVDARCKELDRMAKLSIRLLKKKLTDASVRLGEEEVNAALQEFSRKVTEIAARSKQQMLEKELAKEVPQLRSFGFPHPAVPRHRSTRTIVILPSSDRVENIRLPKMTYEFPPYFKALAKVRVQAERFRGEQVLEKEKNSVQEFADAEALLLRLVMRVFIAFAEEGYKIGIEGGITVEELELECLRFLRTYAFEAGLMDDRFLVPPNGDVEIPDGLRREMEKSEEWKRYRGLLINLAEAQGGHGPLSPEPPAPSPRSADAQENNSTERACPKQFVDAAKRQAKRSYEKFASKIGIRKGTLYAITKETRWVSDDSYILVAQACKCKPEDLYPRDIPKPERRGG